MTDLDALVKGERVVIEGRVHAVATSTGDHGHPKFLPTNEVVFNPPDVTEELRAREATEVFRSMIDDGHLKILGRAMDAMGRPDDREFEDMTDPPLADRLRAFEAVLLAEPCQREGGCELLSKTESMCPACRLRMRFYHVVRNAEAYEGGPGAVPRRHLRAVGEETWTRVVADMTPEQAAFVRELRVDRDLSWRGVAEECYCEWGGSWDPPSNQLVGIAICERAATFTGEHYMEGAWN